jgi:calcium/calmodulin-dependent protein kinase (CaM kinase) II
MCAPTVRLLSEDVAVVCYVRLVQWVNLDGEPETARSEETRVWHRVEGTWKHVHFHRSTCD